MARIILVDERNRRCGLGDKRLIHKRGLLHRAFSIFLIDRDGRILVQKRHPKKYHSASLWANSCCGHPTEGESTLKAATRRLSEELGLAAPLRFAFFSRYSAAVSDHAIENEYVYVFFGPLDAKPIINRREISDVRLLSLPSLQRQAREAPESLCYWLRHYLSQHKPALETWINSTARTAKGPSSIN